MTAAAKSKPKRAKATVAPLLPQQQHLEPVQQPILNTAYDSGLQINQEGPRDIVLIVSLVEEHVFPVVTLSRVLLKDAFPADPMLHAELLPEFVSD